jgi:hypothetical protein
MIFSCNGPGWKASRISWLSWRFVQYRDCDANVPGQAQGLYFGRFLGAGRHRMGSEAPVSRMVKGDCLRGFGSDWATKKKMWSRISSGIDRNEALEYNSIIIALFKQFSCGVLRRKR